MTAPSPGGVQRYYINAFLGGYGGEPHADWTEHEDPDGDWVRYGDHVEVVAKLRELLFLAAEKIDACNGWHMPSATAFASEIREALRGAAGEVRS